jgi:hypothetical protein
MLILIVISELRCKVTTFFWNMQEKMNLFLVK